MSRMQLVIDAGTYLKQSGIPHLYVQLLGYVSLKQITGHYAFLAGQRRRLGRTPCRLGLSSRPGSNGQRHIVSWTFDDPFCSSNPATRPST